MEGKKASKDSDWEGMWADGAAVWGCGCGRSPDWLVEYGLEEGDALVDSHARIVRRYFAELYEDKLGLSNYQFMVAPRQTGASPHFHYTSARLMVHGRARYTHPPRSTSLGSFFRLPRRERLGGGRVTV